MPNKALLEIALALRLAERRQHERIGHQCCFNERCVYPTQGACFIRAIERALVECARSAAQSAVTETQVLDVAAVTEYLPRVREAAKLAGGRIEFIGPTEQITPVVGDAPKRIGISEWENLEKVEAWLNSAERKALAPQRDKAQKITRQFIVEGVGSR